MDIINIVIMMMMMLDMMDINEYMDEINNKFKTKG